MEGRERFCNLCDASSVIALAKTELRKNKEANNVDECMLVS